MANKKKILIPIFAVSAVALLFGGLIYVGASTFPELLEPNQKEQVNSPKEAFRIKEEVTISYDDSFTQNESIPALVGYTTSVNGDNTQNLIATDIKVSSSGSTNSVKEEKVATFHTKDFFMRVEVSSFETGLVSSNFVTNVESNQSHEHLRVSMNESSVSTKVNKKVASPNNRSTSSHREIAECSILVIGIVNILSFLLVAHRKRKMFR
ncbi:MAG: hypothetical protein J6X50_01735 [Bacilli bacterium]|nr:hypothetical protein [Bacilli bacterium]